MNTRLRFPALCTAIGLLAALSTSNAMGDEIQPYFLMDREPGDVLEPEPSRLHPKLLGMWKQALAHSESEMKRQAAEAILRAHQLGHQEMQTAIPDLTRVLTADKVHPAARHAAAHALIGLDSRDSASQLFDVSQTQGQDLRQLIEPVLARWGFEAIRPVWRQRIASVQTPRRDLRLAIDGVQQQRDAAVLSSLLDLAMTAERPIDLRLAAARAAGQIAEQKLEPQAQELLGRGAKSTTDRLCAAALISRHRSEPAITLLQKLGTDPEPAVAGAALRSLFAADPDLVLPLLQATLANADSNIRRVGIQTGVARPTPERIQMLAPLLNDPHPELRGMIRDDFATLSKDAAFDATIRQSAIAVLAGNDWRGQEQAALLLGALDEETVAPRLLELLAAERPEVTVAAAWSLKTMEIPATAQPVLEFAQRRTSSTVPVTAASDHQVAHLFELLGRLKFSEAIPVMSIYIPKTDKFGIHSRSAAIWGLGLIHEGQTNEPLAKQLIDRVLDTMSIPPEDFHVRRASVLSLGRLRAKNQLPVLKQLIGDQVDRDLMELTMRWSVLQISGEVLPIGPPVVADQTGWFLEPLPPPRPVPGS